MQPLQPLQRHHHFRKDLITPTDRLAKLEAHVVSMLQETHVGDDERDSSIAFELKHQAGVIQCGRILAAKRSLDVDLAAAGALLHDIYVIVTGSYEDHARRGGPIAGDILDQVGPYSSAEKNIIDRIVINHSDKHVTSDDIYAEFGKDADVLDCFQYPDALDEYLLVKPLTRVKSYFRRAQDIWVDLGIPVPRLLRCSTITLMTLGLWDCSPCPPTRRIRSLMPPCMTPARTPLPCGESPRIPTGFTRRTRKTLHFRNNCRQEPAPPIPSLKVSEMTT